MKRSQQAAALFNAFSDQTAATRELLVNNLDAGIDPSSEMLATLRQNHTTMTREALTKLPATPDLTSTEHAA